MTILRVPVPCVQSMPPLPEAHRSILLDAQIERLIDVTLNPRQSPDDKRVVLRALVRELVDGAVAYNLAVARDGEVGR